MKKYLFALLFLAYPAGASFFPPQLTPYGLNGSTVAVVTGPGALMTVSTNTAIPQAVFLASGTSTTPFYFNPASTVGTVSTNTIVLQAVQLASGTATNPFIVDEAYALQLASSTFNVILVSSGSNTNPFYVSVLSSGSSTNPWNVVVPVAVQLSSGGPNNPLNVSVVNVSTISGTVSINQGAGNPVSGLLTSATSVVASTFSPAAFTTAGFTIWPGTSTGITANFEISPDSGTTWILVHSYQNIPDPSNGKVVYQTYPLTTSTTTFRTSITGMTNFRVRASAWTTGIASVTITLSAIGDSGIQTINIGQLGGSVILNGGANGSMGVGGITALGSSPNSLPVHTGGLATVGTTLPTKRGDGTITNWWLTGLGSQVSTLDCSRDNIVKSSTTLPSNTTEVIILSSAAASTYNDMLNLLAINTSTTAARVDFRSGGGPGGTTVDFALYLPAGDTRGMATPHIWPQTTAAANWTAQSSGSIVDIRLYATFCKSQ